jgi:hypothetical protein
MSPNAPICPRCRGFIPSNLTPGFYPGAISRVDNKTEICSDCGREEAFNGLVFIEEWPVSGTDGFEAATDRASERILAEIFPE